MGGSGTMGSGRGKLSRRALLGGAAAAGALAWAGPLARWGRAAQTAASDRYFVFCYFSGGWDVLLSLDPRDPAEFHAGNLENTLIYPGYELLQVTDGQLVEAGPGMTFGPAIGELARHAERLSVVRGMSMDTLTHEAGRRRFLTGKQPSGLQARGSSAATWLASTLGAGDPIPNLSMRVESFNVDQPNYATALKVSTVDDLLRALSPSDPGLSPLARQQIDELLAKTSQCAGAEASTFWQAAEEARGRAAEMVAADLDALFDFMADTPAMGALREAYAIESAADAAATPRAQAALAAQAIKGGVSRVVSVQVASGLDTHYDEWEDEQPERQLEGFDAVARLVDDLAASEYPGGGGESWLDHTTLVGFSEFSRTAMINERGGRDHSLTNSCFLLGAGIAGGSVIGRSSDVGMLPTPTDLVTGEPDPDGEIVRPEHVIRALLHDVGVTEDVADLRVEPLAALLG